MALADYEDQFEYSRSTIYIRQVHSTSDIPQRQPTNTRSMGPTVTLSATPIRPPQCGPSVAPATAIKDTRDASVGPTEEVDETSDHGTPEKRPLEDLQDCDEVSVLELDL